MFSVKSYWLAAMAAGWVLTSLGCGARSQESNSSLPSTPVTRFSSPTPAPAPQRGLHGVISGSAEITPGHNVGAVRIGDPPASLLALWGDPNEEYTFDEKSLGPCRYSEAHWLDLDHEDRWGIFAYSNNNRIYQIMVDTPRYATSGGLTSDSTPEEVRRRFPKTEAYELQGSGSEIVGGRDLIYWVDQSAGIAFEFYYHRRLHKRRVLRIIVFDPGVEFSPAGCVSPPQELIKLKPFVLEPD